MFHLESILDTQQRDLMWVLAVRVITVHWKAFKSKFPQHPAGVVLGNYFHSDHSNTESIVM